ncbi:condensation domain-containing protein [Nocardia sp. JMUB6875]|uniref:phthiocerol/phthiodiolone dimycocerosyl transferase family protein n=1 Tax=Nocardia sp. JMUB6875 TaxID=3158170 RepID=UPI0032E7C2FC
MTTAATRFGRRLSPSERWFWIIDRLSPANCVARVRIHGQVGADRLAAAAAALLVEYPLLRMAVVDNCGQDPWLMPLDAPRIPVRRVAGDGQTWIAEMDAELARPFEIRAGLARMVHIVSEAGADGEFHDVLLTISHIIMDGRSLLTLLRKVVVHAGGIANDPVLERDSMPAADDLIPAAARGFWRYAYINIADQLAALASRPHRLDGPSVAMSARRTRIVYRVVDREMLADLISDCRRSGVTVHAAVTAAVADAIGRASNPGAPGVAGIASPVDFRHLLDPLPDRDELGIYAPVLIGFVPFGPAVPLWSAARAVKRQLDRGVRQRKHLSTVAGMRFGTPKAMAAGQRLANMVDRRAPWNVSVTNVGRVEFPDRVGGSRLSGLILAAANSCVSVMTVAVATAHDEMHIAFCYVDKTVTEQEAEEFAEAVLAALLRRPEPSADPMLQQRA